MSLLEKIIYIADYLEPGRTELPNMADVRSLVFRDIDECLYRILKDSLVYLETKHLPIDIMTEKTYLYYKETLKKQEENSSQVDALVDNVEEKMHKAGYSLKQQEGTNSGTWVLMDYGDIIVHIFDKENRSFYNLEHIWSDGREVEM